MATCKDVAQRAGVSTATVTRAFESGSTIKESTRQRILQIAHEMQYTPNLTARSLKQQRTHTIGITLKDADNPFYMQVAKRLEHRLLERNYRALLSFADPVTLDETKCLEVMFGSRVDGVIFSPETTACASVVDAMQAQNIRFLQIFKHSFANLDALCIENELGVFMAAQYLLDLGHRRMLFISDGHDARIAGFWRALETRQVPPFCAQEVPLEKDAAEATAHLRAEMDRIHPTAMICIANRASTVAFRLLWDMGLRIPEDMSLIINDDLQWCQMLDITTVAHPYDEIAQCAVDKLLDRLENPSQPQEPKTTWIKPLLIRRKSVSRIAPGE
ncbi:substrate-binding domain-containing protein [Beduinella massiliensis]|uniref:substrate-binding domain-containing protein n=1 Tax=Beduinella massiliensis TaxID=1852363 RepID=UPI000C8232C2